MKHIKGHTLIMTAFFSVFIGAILFIVLAFVVGAGVFSLDLQAQSQVSI